MSSFDAYVDRQVDRFFRRMPDGTLVWLPWGRGRGYLVTSDERYQRIRQFVRTVVTVGTFGMLMGPGLALVPLRVLWPFLIVFALGYSAVFRIAIRRLAGDLPRTSEAFRLPSWRERRRMAASDLVRLYGVTASRVVMVVSALFALLCMFVGIVVAPETWLGSMGLALLGAACALWLRYGLRIVREEDKSPPSK